MKKILLGSALLCTALIANAQQTINVLNIRNAKELRGFFAYTGKDVPFISGHRGGVNKGFPENSLEAFENTLRHTPATFEIDPRLTKDSMIVLMHDATLERTTTGKGKVGDYTLAELKQLYLKDVEGNVTAFRIPTLEEAIDWAKGKTVLILDKKDVPFEMTAAIIKKHKAEGHVMVTVHTAKEAKWYHDRNPEIVFEAFVKTQKALEEYEAAGIPWTHIMAYVGPDNKPELAPLYANLNKRGVMCMISTAPTYDKLPGAEERAAAYRSIIEKGASLIEADRSIEAADAIASLVPAESPKKRYFGKKKIR
ncbi:glycerophosphodiester phosphodiesterase family protein [Chitinophaga sp. GCM10012297]|uniref:Glycerophosphodiester phosphodiesterase family protein n=1 Tax=Chitinophaga chungangae TaxID=2821488 RepID=A0ABS3YBB8_9BACT|nr:glycerophosphodiester phosphodiesterase family protein [Chitinophaga chungangae]MBO9151972.1 glycerophosphodiester phosphodiesterase family protein [Chitinophaga chungangae]